MSAINGDKARFHKARKKKIQRRLSNQAMFKAVAATPKSAKRPPRQEPS